MMKKWVQSFFKMMKERHELMLRTAAQGTGGTLLTWEGTKISDHLSPADWQQFREDLDEQIKQRNDRSVVILSHAFLDDRLRWLHEVNMINELSNAKKQSLFDRNGPLATYKSRCDLAHALGLINTDFLSELGLLGKIRNKFAHDFRQAKLDDPSISERCDQLGRFTGDAALVPGNDRRMNYAGHCFLAMTALFAVGQMILARRQSTT